MTYAPLSEVAIVDLLGEKMAKLAPCIWVRAVLGDGVLKVTLCLLPVLARREVVIASSPVRVCAPFSACVMARRIPEFAPPLGSMYESCAPRTMP